MHIQCKWLQVEMSLILYFLWSLVEVHSQTAPYVSFMNETLSNNTYAVNPYLVGNEGGSSVQCHTNLVTCCSKAEGGDRGDWYFPNGERLPFSGLDNIYEARGDRRVELRRRYLFTDMPAGLYQCEIAVQGLMNISLNVGVYTGKTISLLHTVTK